MTYKVYITEENNCFYATHNGVKKIMEMTDIEGEWYAEFPVDGLGTDLALFYKPTGRSFSQELVRCKDKDGNIKDIWLRSRTQFIRK